MSLGSRKKLIAIGLALVALCLAFCLRAANNPPPAILAATSATNRAVVFLNGNE